MEPKPPVKIEFCRSHPLVKLTVLAALVLSTFATITLGSAILESKLRISMLREQAAQLTQDTQRLESRLEALDTPEGELTAAREELGLVDPDTVVFDTTSSS